MHRAESIESIADLIPNGQPFPACFQRIKDAWPGLSRVERRVAREVVQDPRWVIFTSAKEVAERSGTSESAVTRFAQRLGFRGFPEFKIVLSQDLVEPLQHIHEDIDVADDLHAISQKLVAANMEGLRTTLEVLDTARIQAAVDHLLRARSIAFVGVGGSAVLALDAYHKFLRTGLQVAAVTDPHEQLMRAAIAEPTDAFVFLSHTGATREIIEVAELARTRGATLIAVTAFGRSPLTRLADVVLHTSTRETLYRAEALSSRLAALTITDILYVGVAVRLHERMLENLPAIRTAIARRRL